LNPKPEVLQVDVEQYDKVCKVEPFQRGLKTLKTGEGQGGRKGGLRV
jgi:hypothetical protein